MSELNLRFVYFDTGIISHIAKDKTLWSRLRRFLEERDMILGICEAQLLELHDAKGLHERISELISTVPSGMMKRRDTILSEEVHAYPNQRGESLSHLPYLLNAIPSSTSGEDLIRKFLSEDVILSETRKQQIADAEEMKTRLPSLKENFPPSTNGNYTVSQASEFIFDLTVQWLLPVHRDFLLQFKDDAQSFRAEAFLSVQLYALVVFYKYYLGRREPKKSSDFGDLFHLMLIPYCEIAIMERDLCETLKQIKRNHAVLDSTGIRNIDFLKEWQ